MTMTDPVRGPSSREIKKKTLSDPRSLEVPESRDRLACLESRQHNRIEVEIAGLKLGVILKGTLCSPPKSWFRQHRSPRGLTAKLPWLHFRREGQENFLSTLFTDPLRPKLSRAKLRIKKSGEANTRQRTSLHSNEFRRGTLTSSRLQSPPFAV